MKILMVSHYFASHKGGIEIVADGLYRALSTNQAEVVWLAGDASPGPEPVGSSHALPVRVHNFVENKTGLPFPLPSRRTIRQITQQVLQADVVILHDCLYLTNVIAFLAATVYRKPTLTIQHIGALPTSKPLLNLLLSAGNHIVVRPILAKASQVVFISESTRNHFSSVRFKNTPEVIFNGVDTEVYRMRSDSESLQSLRQEFGLNGRATTILFVGRFVEKKGLGSLRKMAERRPDWTWVFAGWGPLNPGRWNIPNVRVFSGLSGQSIAALYRACDLLVLPSVGEGFPLVIQEAIASGLPVVCGEETLRADPALGTLAKGVPVFFGDDDRTASEFLVAIEESLASPEYMAQARRDFAVQHYSWERAKRGYQEIICRLVPQPSTSREQTPAGAGNL